MLQEVKTICLSLPYKLGSVNCFLIKTDFGYILIDTGSSNQRSELERELEEAGCRPGDLKLIILTHGDFDHTGNAAYLRKMFATKIAMHIGDTGMIERGDMFWNRGRGNFLMRMMVPILTGFGKSERCKPDIYIEEGYDLSGYGFDAKVINIPGHSKGSIGILTAGGDPSAGSGQVLFCGDLLMNDKSGPHPGFGYSADFRPSLEKLKSLEIETVYPGHGKPFPLELFVKNFR